MVSTKAQLTCIQCVKRKKRCDKAVPCSACVEKGLQCTPIERKRLPRGRSGKTTRINSPAELKERIAALEDAVSRLRHSQTSNGVLEVASASSTYVPEMASDFWNNLIDTFGDIQELLQPELETGNTPREIVELEAEFRSDFLFTHSYGEHTKLNRAIVSLGEERQLMDFYQARIDPLLKVLDWSELVRSWSYPADGDVPLIQAAVLFGASATIMPQDGMDPYPIVEHLRALCGHKLSSARVLTTTSVDTLKSFIIYLAALRATRAHSEQWTLIPLAIRIANSLRVPKQLVSGGASEDYPGVRIWSCIGLLDLQSAFDRGSTPLLSFRELDILPDKPLTTYPAPWTDSTTSWVIYRASLCQRNLIECMYQAVHQYSARKPPPEDWWKKPKHIVDDFERYVTSSGLTRNGIGDSPSSLQLFTKAIAEECILTMRLLMYRPFEKLPFVLCRIIPHDIDVLGSALKVLASTDFKQQDAFRQWAWFIWVKWYVLAIALTELCRLGSDWPLQTQDAWALVTTCYDRYEALVSDTGGGLLWTPIAKLYARARSLWQQQNWQQPKHIPDIQVSPEIASEHWADYLPVDYDYVEWDMFLNDMHIMEGN